MLVISRDENEALRIGDTVKITVIKTSDGKAELLIETPQEVLVKVVDEHNID